MAARQTTMNISLPSAYRKFVREQMNEGGFGNASEYVRHLLREEHVRASRRRLQRLLQEGLESGPATPMTPRDWAELQQRVLGTLKQSRRKSA